jgi:hypothetical protein
LHESLHTASSDEELTGAVRFRAVIRGVPGISIPVPVGAAATTDAPATGFVPAAGAVSSRPIGNDGSLAASAAVASPETSWTRPDVVRAVALAVYLLLQVGIPLRSYLSDEGSARYSWRMYSSLLAQPPYLVEFHDGTRDTVPLSKYAINARVDINWPDRYPAHLCAVVPGAVAAYRGATPFSTELRVPCRR